MTHLVRFDPPSTTTITFLGSLKGGSYREVYETETNDEGTWRVTGFFDHERLQDDGPLRIEYHPIRSANPRAAGRQGAIERMEQLRELFRRWATAPPERQSV